jgi:hypothetical protein
VKGIVCSALMFYAGGKLQRVLLGVSLSVMVARPLILTIMPSCRAYLSFDFVWEFVLTMALAGTLAIAAVTFRATSALYTLRFVPSARLQLAIGALLPAVLLTTLVTINGALLHRAMPRLPLTWGSPTGSFIATLSVMTLWVLWAFLFVRRCRRPARVSYLDRRVAICSVVLACETHRSGMGRGCLVETPEC